MEAEPITMLVTSCDRLDLLERTLSSFFALNTYPLDEIILHEDSGKNNLDKVVSILRRVCPKELPMKVLISEKRGLSGALDELFYMAKTEYVFTCEDDWLFEGNPDFMLESLKLLKALPSVHQVWVRNKTDHGHPLLDIRIRDGVKYRPVKPGYGGNWCGFSWNPGLRRKSDWRKMFPYGFQEYGDEILCNAAAMAKGYSAVSLVNTACRHIGYGRHTNGFVL